MNPFYLLSLRFTCLVAALIFSVSGLLSEAAPAPAGTGANGALIVFIGTYTGKKSQGIYRFRLDPVSGAPSAVELAAKTENPSFLAIHPNRRWVYSVNEVAAAGGKSTGQVTAFAIDPQSGDLVRLNEQSSGGGGPCHLSVDKTGKAVLVANYGGGSVAALPIEESGRLKPATAFIQHQGKSANPDRQAGPHAHSINLDPSNRFAIAADLGLDQLLVYRFDPSRGSLEPNQPPTTALKAGSGPRHFTFLSNQYAYVINEMHSTATALRYDAQRGTLDPFQTVSTLPSDFPGKNNSTAEIQAHPNGRFVYGSNRGHNSIAVFGVNLQTGALTLVQHQPTEGRTPRNFGIDPAGHYLLAANQDSDSVVIFRIDPQTGRLTGTGHKVEVPVPVCVKFLQP